MATKRASGLEDTATPDETQSKTRTDTASRSCLLNPETTSRGQMCTQNRSFQSDGARRRWKTYLKKLWPKFFQI